MISINFVYGFGDKKATIIIKTKGNFDIYVTIHNCYQKPRKNQFIVRCSKRKLCKENCRTKIKTKKKYNLLQRGNPSTVTFFLNPYQL